VCARKRGRDRGEKRFTADATVIIVRIQSIIRRRRRRIWLPFSNGHAELLVAALPVLGLETLTTACDELTAGTVLKCSKVAGNAAIGALLGREGGPSSKPPSPVPSEFGNAMGSGQQQNPVASQGASFVQSSRQYSCMNTRFVLSTCFEPLAEHGWSQGWLGLVLRRRLLGFAAGI
jgi:hypothetical protein